MSKKHGFRGTPIRPSNRPGTMGRVFETRGDPLVSPREGREKFGRNLETENPDYDRMFAPIARDLLKPSQIDRTSALRKLNAKTEPDIQRKTAQIMCETRNKIAAAQRGAQVCRTAKSKEIVGDPDHLPKAHRVDQTPKDAPSRSYYDFTGKSPPKEIKKNGKIYRRK